MGSLGTRLIGVNHGLTNQFCYQLMIRPDIVNSAV